jgi:hypothetical protein
MASARGEHVPREPRQQGHSDQHGGPYPVDAGVLGELDAYVSPECSLGLARVTMMRVANRHEPGRQLGNEPSPIVGTCTAAMAVWKDSPCRTIPTTKPPSMFMTLMKIPTFTVPDMNFGRASI